MENKTIYQNFRRETAAFKHPLRFGYDWFLCALDKVWQDRETSGDLAVHWTDMEAMQRDILRSDYLLPEQQISLLSQSLAAFTGRGEAK